MKKRFLLILLALSATCCLAFALAGCSPAPNDNTGNNTEQSGNTGSSDNSGNSGNSGGSSGGDNTGSTTEPETPDTGNTEHVHDWGDWEVTTPATCSAQGEETRTCKSDENHKETRKTQIDPEAHDFGELIITPATCTTKGVEAHYHCACGKFFNKDKIEVSEQQLLTLPVDGNGHVLNTGESVCANCGTSLTVNLKYSLLNDNTYSVSLGTATDNNIIIPAIYDGKPVTSIGKIAFRESKLTSITIPNSVTAIGDSAFYNCTSLASVNFDDNSKLETIGQDAFGDCKNLAQISIPNNVTAIGSSAFYNCSKLKSITIPDSVTSIGGSAFLYCTNLKSVTIGDGVTSIGYQAFYYCTSLERVYITNLAAWCNIDFDYYEANPLNHAHALYLNSQLVTQLDIPQGVKEIKSYAFYMCTSLTTITIPNSVTAIGDYAFDDCSNLDSVDFDDNSKIKTIGQSAFVSCENLASINFGANCKAETIGDDAFSGCTNLENIIIPDGAASIGSFAFYNCANLTSITIPASVTSIGDRAFSGCKKLTEVYIIDLAAWCNIDFGDDAFNPISSPLHNLYLDNKPVTDLNIPQGVKEIKSYAFYRCKNITSITIPDSVTAIGDYVFNGCTKLSNITVGENNTAYSSQDGILYNKEKTQFIHIPILVGGIVNIPDGITSIGDRAFYQSEISGINFGANNKLETIGREAFYECRNLEWISIPSSVTYIGHMAFRGCTRLMDINFGSNSKLETIGEMAFYECKNIRDITIPASVTTIYSFAFCGCTSLTSVTFLYTTGWKAGNTAVSVSNSANNAKLLTKYYFDGGYVSYTWDREG